MEKKIDKTPRKKNAKSIFGPRIGTEKQSKLSKIVATTRNFKTLYRPRWRSNGRTGSVSRDSLLYSILVWSYSYYDLFAH